MNYVRHLALVFAVFVLAACSSNSVQVDVLVYTSLVPGPQFATIENELLEPTAPTEPARLLDTVRGNATFGDDFVHGRRVASFASLSPGDYVVNVRLVRPDGTLLVGRRVRFQASADRVIPVVLTPDCVGVTCPSPTGSPALSACFGGQCVDERCHPPDPEFCPTLTLCNSAADCPIPSAACATAECVAGLCTNTATPSACAANEWCDPDHGCLPREQLSDGGLGDAANVDATTNLDASVDADASMDASSDRCGLACELDGDPCHLGALRCDETGESCVPFATRPPGTPCGADQVCDSYGACGTCTAGARCTVRCLVGTTRCNAGIETCDVGAGDVTVAPGDACSLDSVCHEGDSCGSGTTCSADHVCELCTNDGDACSLANGCQTGTVQCAAGHICVADSAVSYGATCALPGDSSTAICDGAGACVPCVDGTACTWPGGCTVGKLVCTRDNPYGYPIGACDPNLDYYSGSNPGDATVCDGGVCSGHGQCTAPLVAAHLGHHTPCAIRADGSAACWRPRTDYYRGARLTGLNLVEVSGVPPLLEITEGLAVDVDGVVWDWTDGGAPHAVSLPARAVDVKAGDLFGLRFACVLLEGGQLMCRGDHRYNGIGDSVDHTDFVALPALSHVVAFDAGGYTAVAITSDGAVLSWGNNWWGVAGNSTVIMDSSEAQAYLLTPTTANPISGAARVSNLFAGRTCAVTASGSVVCWGIGFGPDRLFPYGLPTTTVPTVVPLAYSDAVAVSPLTDALCVLRSTGEVWCSGSAWFAGREGFPAGYVTPGPVARIANVVELEEMCALTNAGAVYCWNYGTVPVRIGQDAAPL